MYTSNNSRNEGLSLVNLMFEVMLCIVKSAIFTGKKYIRTEKNIHKKYKMFESCAYIYPWAIIHLKENQCKFYILNEDSTWIKTTPGPVMGVMHH